MDDVFKALYSIRIHGIIVTLFNNAILISSSRYVAGNVEMVITLRILVSNVWKVVVVVGISWD